jgi:hypothetical protein
VATGEPVFSENATAVTALGSLGLAGATTVGPMDTVIAESGRGLSVPLITSVTTSLSDLGMGEAYVRSNTKVFVRKRLRSII